MTAEVWEGYRPGGMSAATVDSGAPFTFDFADATVIPVLTTLQRGLGSLVMVIGDAADQIHFRTRFRSPVLDARPWTLWYRLVQLVDPPAESGDPRVDPKIAIRVLATLNVLIAESTLEPSFFPLADGGVLAKWTSMDGGSLHIEFDADDDVVMALDDRSTGTSTAGSFSSHQGAAQEWLARPNQ